MYSSPTIITQTQHKVNQAGGPAAPQAQLSSTTVSGVATDAGLNEPASPSAALDTVVSPQFPQRPPAALFEDTEAARYLVALALVRHVEDGLGVPRRGYGRPNIPSRHYRRGGRLLTTLDEVVRAILAYDLEVG